MPTARKTATAHRTEERVPRLHHATKRAKMRDMNIDLTEYGIDVGGDEALQEAVSVAVALEEWGEQFRAGKFARGEAVVVGRHGKAFLEGPEGHFRPVPEDRPLTWEDIRFPRNAAP